MQIPLRVAAPIVLAILLTLLPVPARAQIGLDPDTAENLEQFLSFLTSSAGALAIGGALSFILAKIPAYNALSDELKWYLVLTACIALGILSQLALTYVPPPFWIAVQPYWQVAVRFAFALVGTQAAFFGLVRPARLPCPEKCQ